MSQSDSTPPVAPDTSGRRTHSWVVFLAVFAAFAVLQLAYNPHVFVRPIYEDLDYAANSLLVLKAKRLELLHGHYSRMGFYHPGPALLYVLAAAEWALYDVARVVPEPHNAHMVAHVFLNAALIAVALTIAARAVGLRAGAAAAVAFLVYFAREGHFSSHWFAMTFFMVYLPFQVAAASVAAGRTAHLGWLALTASLAVHSHASFVLFVVPISLYALARVRGARGDRAWRAWRTFAAIVALFVLPIVLHIALDYPGEIRRYLDHRKLQMRESGGPADLARFLIHTLTNNSPLGWPLAAGVAVGAVASALTFPARGRRFARQLLVVGAMSSVAMTYYAARGVDDYANVYLGIFFGSVLLLGWTLIAMRVALLGRGALWRGGTSAVGAGLAVWAAATGNFFDSYEGVPGMPAVADAISADPRWETGPPLMTLEDHGWVEGGALLIQLERRGKRPWLIESHMRILYTDAFRPGDRLPTVLWHLDAASADSPAVPTRRVLGQFPVATIRELETRCPFGGPVPLGGRGRLPGVKLVDGWALPKEERLVPLRERAVLLIDLEPCPVPRARMTISGYAVPTPKMTGQRVCVEVNGEPVGEATFALGSTTQHHFDFAGELLNRRSPVQMVFTFPDVGDPSVLRGPRDRIRFSVEMTGLALTPAP